MIAATWRVRVVIERNPGSDEQHIVDLRWEKLTRGLIEVQACLESALAAAKALPKEPRT